MLDWDTSHARSTGLIPGMRKILNCDAGFIDDQIVMLALGGNLQIAKCIRLLDLCKGRSRDTSPHRSRLCWRSRRPPLPQLVPDLPTSEACSGTSKQNINFQQSDANSNPSFHVGKSQYLLPSSLQTPHASMQLQKGEFVGSSLPGPKPMVIHFRKLHSKSYV